MKKLQIVGVALIAIFALGAILAGPASAVTFLLALWLVNGAVLESALLVEQEGELELIDTKTAIGEVKILCSGYLDGFVEPESKDLITELLNLLKEPISKTALTGLSLVCTSTLNCGGTPEVWAVGLPWETEVELMEDTTNFFVDLILNGKYYALCTILGVRVSDECSSEQTAVELTNNENGTVDAVFSDPFQELAGLTLGTCTQGGAASAVVNGLATILPDEGSLSVSSE